MLQMEAECYGKSSRAGRSQVLGVRNSNRRGQVVLRPGTYYLRPEQKKQTRCAVWWAENEPVSDGGNTPRPIRLFRMTERRTPYLFASRVPVHSSLFHISFTTSTNSAGRLSPWML